MFFSKMDTRIERWTLHLMQAWSVIVMLYTSGRRKGWKYNLLHAIVCFIISFFFNVFLFLCLHYSLRCDLVLSVGIAGTCVVVVTTVLFLSKSIRCFGILFLISCGMKQGRNLLITAGTGLVVFWNVKNTIGNLNELVRSIECNLEKKRLSIDLTPLSNYVKVLKWVVDQLKGITDLGVIRITSEFTTEHKTDSKELMEKLQQAHRELNATVESTLIITTTVYSVCHKVLLVLGTILPMVFTALYLRKYNHNRRFQNTFITSKFIQYDAKQKLEGKPHVLPLSEEEAKRYIAIPSPHLMTKEGKLMLKFCIPVINNLLIWILFIGVDSLLYWFILGIRKHLEEIEPFHVPLIMKVREEVSIIDVQISGGHKTEDFSFTVALFENECLPEPSLSLYQSVTPLAIILVSLVILGLLSAKLMQLKLLVSAEFYGDNANERVEYLHAKILRRRSKTKLKDQRHLMKTLLKKDTSPVTSGIKLSQAEGKVVPEQAGTTSFWFPIVYRQKDDTVQLT